MFAAVKAGKPTPELLAYQYLQTLPQMAQGDANKVWMIPSDFSKSLEGFARMLGTKGDDGVFRYEPPKDEPADAAKPRPGRHRRRRRRLVRGHLGRRGGRRGRGRSSGRPMVTIEQQDAARAAAYRDRRDAAAPERPADAAARSDAGPGSRPPPQGNYPTQGYPGRDAPAGPPPGLSATGWRSPGSSRPTAAGHAPT